MAENDDVGQQRFESLFRKNQVTRFTYDARGSRQTKVDGKGATCPYRKPRTRHDDQPSDANCGH